MRNKYKSKIVAVFLAFLMLFAGCSSKLLSSDMLIINDKKVSVPYVLKINGYEVEADEYRCIFMNLKNSMEEANADFEWTQENADAYKLQVLEYIALNRAVVEYAAKQGILLSEVDQDEVESNINSSIEEAGGRVEFKQALADAYMTQRLFKIMAEHELLEKMLNEKIFINDGEFSFTEDEMQDIVNSEYVCIRYLQLDKDTNGTTTNKDRAYELLQRIKNGENFGELVNEYGRDSTMRNNPDGRYFTRGMVDTKIEEASYALKIGETSDVVEGENGYFIIKRQPINKEFVNKNIDNIIYHHQEKLFSEKLTAIVDTFEIAYGDVYEDISVFSMK